MSKSTSKGNLKRFVEACTTSKASLVKNEDMSPRLVEAVTKTKLKEGVSNAEIWKFPIGRVNTYDKPNANGRVYSRELWENVMNNQRDLWFQSTALADHPEDESAGSFKDIVMVWLGMDISDVSDLVYGYGTFVGPNGSLAKDILDKGGKIGFSSSGFGELMSDGRTVNPDTYEIERLADVVLNPSQGVFGTIDDLDNPTKNVTIEYSKQEPVSQIIESVEPKSQIIKSMENKNMSTFNAVDNTVTAEPSAIRESMSKVEEKAWRKYVESFVNDASNIDNPSKRLTEMVEILSLFEEGVAPDLREKLEEKIVEERHNLEKMIESASKIQEELGDLESITENAKRVIDEGLEMKESYEELEELCKGMRKRNRELVKENSSLKAKLSLKEKKIDRVNKEFGKSLVSTEDKNDKLSKALNEANEKVEKLTKKVSMLEKSNEMLESSLGKYKTRLSSLKESAIDSKNSSEKNATRIEQLTEKNKSLRNQIMQMQEDKDVLKAMIERLKKNNDKLVKHIKEQEEEAEAEKVAEQEAITESKKLYKDRASGFFNFRENQGIDIENYWIDQVGRYGEAIIPFENQIRGAKTLREAQSAFMKNMDKIVPSMGNAFNSFEVGLNEKVNRENLINNGFIMKEDYTTEELNENFRSMREKFGLM